MRYVLMMIAVLMLFCSGCIDAKPKQATSSKSYIINSPDGWEYVCADVVQQTEKFGQRCLIICGAGYRGMMVEVSCND